MHFQVPGVGTTMTTSMNDAYRAIRKEGSRQAGRQAGEGAAAPYFTQPLGLLQDDSLPQSVIESLSFSN